ncbi:hypothetical protein AVEN_241185-1 [Araneus ventricosus]|uniref:Uncharacterized protein n=1 Tax=Araneus ventricosus TaxID=182803 RepID=A0A4Y2FZS0_ARAVE|nr:hypothetical protein AVEN_241185-1 [Araneus ventricosus]
MSLERKWMFAVGGCGQQLDKSLRLNFSALLWGLESEGLRSEGGRRKEMREVFRDRMIDEDKSQNLDASSSGLVTTVDSDRQPLLHVFTSRIRLPEQILKSNLRGCHNFCGAHKYHGCVYHTINSLYLEILNNNLNYINSLQERNYLRIFTGLGGLVLRSRPRGQKVPASERDSTEEPPCKRLVHAKSSGAKCLTVGVVRKFGEGVRAQVSSSHLTEVDDENDKMTRPSQNSPHVASKRDENIIKLN